MQKNFSNLLTIKRYFSKIPKMPIRAALIDLSGTLHVEDSPTTNAVAALEKLRKLPIKIKFVTNTTKESKGTLCQRLNEIGFDINIDEIFSSLSATATYVECNNLNPFYILTEDAQKDFPPIDAEKSLDSVVVGLAPKQFEYETLNKAFNILIANKDHQLVATHEGRYYKRSDGLALGPGCFTKGLEYSTGTKPVLVGKPNPYFFQSAVPADIEPGECVMIGDDPYDDINGAMQVGFHGIQVKTGKYLANVVIDPPPTAVKENFSEAVDWLLENYQNY